eukprot:3570731-Pyramimonas_sp.AAC.1
MIKDAPRWPSPRKKTHTSEPCQASERQARQGRAGSRQELPRRTVCLSVAPIRPALVRIAFASPPTKK